MTEELTEELTEEELAIRLHAEVFSQLMQFDRFKLWFEMNYVLEKHVNEDDKSILYNLRELSPVEVLQKYKENIEKAKKADPTIVLASEQDLKQIDKVINKVNK